MPNIKFNVGYEINKADLKNIELQIQKVRENLEKKKLQIGIDTTNIEKQERIIQKFQEILNRTTIKSPNGGYIIDSQRFQYEVQKANHTLNGMNALLNRVGVDASEIFNRVQKDIEYTGVKLKEQEGIIEKFSSTFLNAFRWNLASIGVHQIEGFVQNGIRFIRQLDDSLNNIRIVSGATKEDMEVFAKSANRAAKELGKTTKEYTDASLIFFQQGKSKAEVEKLTKATLISANITGQATEETAELITAALNGYSMAADKAMQVADKFAAVGARTGANFKELAIGFSKVASMGKVAGVTFDQLNAMVATISTVTRESPESIGTSLKTIFARMSDLKAGKKDEDGWTTGQVEGALNKVGLSLIDQQTGKMKDLGVVIDELGNKWNTLNKESQLAVSTALAGTRQQNRLIALLDNYQTMYKEALEVSLNSEGAALRQQEIRMDSITARMQKLRATAEETWMNFIDTDFLKSAVDALTAIIDKANNLFKVFNGWHGILLSIAFVLRGIAKDTVKSFTVGRGAEWIQEYQNKKAYKKSITPEGKAKELERLASIEKEFGKDSAFYQKELRRFEIREKEAKVIKYLGDEQGETFKNLQKEYELALNKLEVSQNQRKAYEMEREVLKQQVDLQQQLLNQEVTRGKNLKQVLIEAQQKIDSGQGFERKKISTDLLQGIGFDISKYKGVKEGQKHIFVTENDKEFINDLLNHVNTIGTGADSNLKTLKELDTKVGVLRNDEDRAKSAANYYKDMQEDMAKTATKAERITKAIQTTTGAIMVLTAGAASFQEIMESDTPEQRLEAISSLTTSVGASLMTLPFGVTQIAGALMMLSGPLMSILKNLDGIYQAQKRNKKLLEETNALLDKTDNKISNLTKNRNAYAELQALTNSGKTPLSALTKEQIDRYKELADIIASTTPELVAFYDEEGNAIIDTTKNLEDLIKAQKEYRKEIYQLRADNKDSFLTEYGYNIKNNQKIIDESKAVISDPNASSENVVEAEQKLAKARENLNQTYDDFKSNVLESVISGSNGINQILQSDYKNKNDIILKLRELSQSDSIYGAFKSGETLQVSDSLNTLQKFYDMVGASKDKVDKLMNMDTSVLNHMVDLFTMVGASSETMSSLFDKFASLDTSKLTELASSQDAYNKFIGGDKLIEDAENKRKQRLEEINNTLAELNPRLQDYQMSGVPYSDYAELDKQIESLKIEKTVLEENKTGVEILNQSYINFFENLTKTTEGLEIAVNAYNGNIDKLKELKTAIDGGADSTGELKEEFKNLQAVAGRQLTMIQKTNNDVFRQLVTTNAEHFAEMQRMYGIDAKNYSNLAEYEQAVAEAKAKGIVLNQNWTEEQKAKAVSSFANWSGQVENQRLIHIKGINQQVVQSHWEAAVNSLNAWQRFWYQFGFYQKAAMQKYQEMYPDDWKDQLNYSGIKLDKVDIPKPKISSPKLNGPNITGNGSKSGSSSKQRGDDMKKDLDILHDTNIVLEKQEAILDRLQKKEKELYGDELYKNIKAQNAALKEKKMLLEAQIKLIDQEAAKQKQKLSAAGVKFDKDGRITNYNAFIQTKMNQVNSIKDADKFDKAKDAAEELFKLMEQYENYTVKVKIDKQQAIEEINSQLNENLLKDIKFKLEVQLDLAKEKEENLDFLNSISTAFEDIDENYTNYAEKIRLIAGEVKNYQEAIEKVKNSNLTSKQKIELLDDYENKLMQLTKDLKSTKEAFDNLNKKTLQEVNKLLSQQTDQFEGLANDLEFLEKSLDLIGESKNFELKNKILSTQNDIYANEAKAITSVRDELIAYRDTLEEGTEQWYEVNKEIENMNNKLENITTKILENLKSEFKNTFSSLSEEFEKKLFNGQSYKDFKKDYDYLIQQQNKYLSNEEKIIEIGDLQRKVEEQLNETYSERNKEILQDFYDNQLQALKQKDKLTKYDVERAEKIYNITLKQIALEEARNNKTLMKLVRDAQGNWSYQYVEDTRKIQSAQEALSKELRELMEFDKKQLEQTQQEMIQLKYQFMQEIQQIIQDGLNGQYQSQEEMYAAIEQAQTRFNQQIEDLELQRFATSVNVSESTMATVLDTYRTTTGELGILTTEQENILEEMAVQIGTTWTDISNTTQALLNGDVEYFKNNFKLPIEEDTGLLHDIMTGIFNAISEHWTGDLAVMLGNTKTNFEGMSTEVQAFKGNVEGYINDIKTAWEGYQSKVNDVKENVNPVLSDTNSVLDKIVANNKYLDEKTSGITEQIKGQIEAIKGVLESIGDINKIYEDIKSGVSGVVSEVDKLITKLKEVATEKTRTDEILNQQPKNIVPQSTPVPAPKSGGSSSGNKGGSGSSGGGGSNKGGNGSNTGNKKATYNNYGLTVDQAKKLQMFANDVAGYNLTTDGYLGKKSWEALSSSYFAGKAKVYLQDIDRNTAKRVQAESRYTSKVLDIALKIANTPMSQLPKFDTGGYTGEWFDNKGRLAILHQKELILNKQDTSNILKAVQFTRNFADLFIKNKPIAAPAIATNTSNAQNITINAEFPNVTSSDEIKKAFIDLENRAAQYIRNFRK